MTTDNKQVVQPTEPVSTEEPVSPPAEKVEKEIPPAEKQELTEERVQQMIAEATERAVEEAKNAGRRELQSQQDRNKAELTRANKRAEIAERRAKVYEGSFSDLDEDTRDRLERQRLAGENEFYRTREQEEAALRQQEETARVMEKSLRDEVTALGIDPTDKRLDYAPDATSYFEGRKRFSDSVARVVKAEKENLEKGVLQKAEEQSKRLEADFRKKYGLDSQDTTTQTGVVNQSDADFMTAYGAGDLPVNAANQKRYEGIQKKYY